MMRYRDIVIHTNSGIFGREEELKASPPIQQWVELSECMSLGRLEQGLAKAIMDTCEPKALGISPQFRQYAQLYSFVHELSGDVDIHRWDHDNELTAVIGLSRLVHPTAVGFAYAARVGYESEGMKEIFPAQIIGVSKEAFLSPSRTRDWLTYAEAHVLRDLVTSLKQEQPRRVHNALWHHEYATRTYYLDHRWTLVCTGLEALVHTDSTRNTAQFTKRVPALAFELGVNISEPEAAAAYDLRSRLAHGVSLIAAKTSHGPSPAQLHLYDRLEDTLRTAILRSMQDKSFADIFRDDDQIRKRWPI